jgi:excisionase family DNA binding protein
MTKGIKSYLNVKESAEVLGVSTKTIYRLIWRGELPARRVGRILRVPVSALSDENCPCAKAASASEISNHQSEGRVSALETNNAGV